MDGLAALVVLTNPKIQVTGPAAASWAEPGWWRSAGWSRSGGGVEGHRVAELLQFADVVPDLALGVGPGGVVVGAEVDELCVGVGEQRPDDDQDGAADCHDGPLLAAPSGDAAVALAEEGVGAGGADGGLAEDAGEVAVAAGRLARWAAGGFVDSGREAGPGGQVRR